MGTLGITESSGERINRLREMVRVTKRLFNRAWNDVAVVTRFAAQSATRMYAVDPIQVFEEMTNSARAAGGHGGVVGNVRVRVVDMTLGYLAAAMYAANVGMKVMPTAILTDARLTADGLYNQEDLVKVHEGLKKLRDIVKDRAATNKLSPLGEAGLLYVLLMDKELPATCDGLAESLLEHAKLFPPDKLPEGEQGLTGHIEGVPNHGTLTLARVKELMVLGGGVFPSPCDVGVTERPFVLP